MNKTQQIGEFVRISLESDSVDLRQLSVKEAMLGLVLGLLMVVVVVVHLALTVWQLVVGLLLLGYDGLAWILKKVIPRPKVSAEGVDDIQIS